jgi:predicted SAM-dependent methyltransferase
MQRVVQHIRSRFARHLRGRGLEIGALHNPLTIPNPVQVLYSDLLTPEQVEAMYPGSRHPDVVSDSESFPTLPDGMLDFVVANHVLEHLTDPIRALCEWHRILRDGGLLYMAVPDKRFTFDHGRPRTSLEHLEEDHSSPLPPQQRNHAHLLEWAEHVERLVPGSDAFAAWVGEQLSQSYSVHNHVWVAQDSLRVLRRLDEQDHASFALVQWKNASPLRNEFLLLLAARKSRQLTGAERRSLAGAIRLARLQHPLLETCGAAVRLAGRARRAVATAR